MIFQEAIRNGKSEGQPCTPGAPAPEDNSRVRFITYPEEAVIRTIISRTVPNSRTRADLALENRNAAGRVYSLDWDRVDVARRQLHLLKNQERHCARRDSHSRRVSALEELQKRRNPDSPKSALPAMASHGLAPCLV